jgi:hypothetical protein
MVAVIRLTKPAMPAIGAQPALTRLSGAEGIVTIRDGLKRIAPLSSAEAAQEFDFLIRWGAGVPAAALWYPRSADTLATAIQLIVGLVDDLTARPARSALSAGHR